MQGRLLQRDGRRRADTGPARRRVRPCRGPPGGPGVAMDPLNADHHAVLVRSLTAVGDHLSAHRQALRCADLFRRELGCAPPAEVLAAARPMVGRLHLLRGEHAHALAPLDEALVLVGEQGWTAFQPWPEAFRAEVAIASGDPATARELLDHAWVLATKSDDHCWMATVAHGHPTLALAAGQPSLARTWVDRGLAPSPWYLWPHARLLDLACSVAVHAGGAATAQPMMDRLTELAGRASMRDLLVRAYLHRARTGSRQALAAARALAAEVDDPALRTRIHAESGVTA